MRRVCLCDTLSTPCQIFGGPWKNSFLHNIAPASTRLHTVVTQTHNTFKERGPPRHRIPKSVAAMLRLSSHSHS